MSLLYTSFSSHLWAKGSTASSLSSTALILNCLAAASPLSFAFLWVRPNACLVWTHFRTLLSWSRPTRLFVSLYLSYYDRKIWTRTPKTWVLGASVDSSGKSCESCASNESGDSCESDDTATVLKQVYKMNKVNKVNKVNQAGLWRREGK